MHSSSRMMLQAHWYCEVLSWMWIDWLDLPKLTTLRTTTEKINGWYSFTFQSPRHITFESDSHPLWMMFRHAQSHRCVSSSCIPLQEWRHNHRKYSLHPSLTNRHRSSSEQIRLLRRPFFCFSEPPSPHQPTELTQASFMAPRMAWKETNNENRHFKSSESNQNRQNNVNSSKSP